MLEVIDNFHWYAIHVRPNYERMVSRRLHELGIETYLPSNCSKPHPMSKKVKSAPLFFPGYIFALLNLTRGPRLYTVPGIIKILGTQARPTPLSTEEMTAIRAISASSLPVETLSHFHSGDSIRLNDGPLAGVSGTYVSSTANSKFIVSLPLMQRALAVSVPSEWVLAASNISFIQTSVAV